MLERCLRGELCECNRWPPEIDLNDRWGVEFARQHNLKICLEATPFGLPLYSKVGFVPKAECEVDVSRFGGPSSYKWTLMVKEP